MNRNEQELEFLRNTNRELSKMVGIVEDRIQLLKRRIKKHNDTINKGGKT